jgi:hypothetical protein
LKIASSSQVLVDTLGAGALGLSGVFADGGGGISSQHAAVETPPQRQRQSRRFTSSPSPEPLHGNPCTPPCPRRLAPIAGFGGIFAVHV